MQMVNDVKQFFSFWTELSPDHAFPTFGAAHMLLIAVCALSIAFALYQMRLCASSTREKIIRGAAILECALELSHIVWLYAVGQTDIVKLLPLHLCAMQMFLLPIAAFTRRPILREFVFFTSTIGGALAILSPMGVADTYPLFHYQTLQTFALHSLLIFVPLAMLLYQGLQPKLKNFPKLILIFVLLMLPAAAVDVIWGENYMFLNTPPVNTPLETIYNAYGRGAYLIAFFLILCLICVLLYLPFELHRKRRAQRDQSTRAA